MEKGIDIRLEAKNFVLTYLQSMPQCKPNYDGISQSEIFFNCEFDWGEQLNATSSNQQYWVVALLKELEEEGFVQQDLDTKLWRLTDLYQENIVERFMTPVTILRRAIAIKEKAMDIVIEYMNTNEDCCSTGAGVRQATLFRACGFDWGDYEKAESTRQQYWFVGLLRVLENENIVVRDGATKKWRLKG